ncbi:hypothetical protein [Streptomyces sp. NRRL WC-3618]|uniref:hypothetical protein n=1 Tax=Streptomyces sp. NRRL WC-3618 TaxID=1519490 RepID=UPI00099CFCB1|nr:hypothetical protein [Streptomyces sp. NRRL WC-3618]
MVIAVVGVVVVLVLLVLVVVTRYKVAGPREAFIVTGRRGKKADDHHSRARPAWPCGLLTRTGDNPAAVGARRTSPTGNALLIRVLPHYPTPQGNPSGVENFSFR